MFARNLFVLTTSIFALAACDLKGFDGLRNSTWVYSNGKPSGAPSLAKGFGVGLTSAGGGELQYFIASQSPPIVYMAKFDADGNPSPVVTAEIQLILSGAQKLEKSAVMASDTSGGSAGVAVGTFDGTSPTLFMLRGEDGVATSPFPLRGTQSPSGIVFGVTDLGSNGDVDLLAAAGEHLNLIANYRGSSASTISCKLPGTAGDLLLVDVETGSGFEDREVLIAVDGTVMVTTGSAISDTPADPDSDCFVSVPAAASGVTISAPGGEASFGSVMRAGDFNADGDIDLAISAPEQNSVYIFLGWKVSQNVDAIKLTSPSGSARFGAVMDIGDFDGDGADELVISDPGREVQGHVSAGSVFIFQATPSNDFSDPVVLYDASPQDDQVFGQALTVTNASGSAQLVVGAKDEIFTYFRTPVPGDEDYRQNF